MSAILAFPAIAPDAVRVLLAEDDALLRRRLKRILQSEGFAVIAAEDGAEALSLSIEFAPDLILSDIKMPRLDGYGLLEAVQANPDTAHIPFMFLTVRDKPDELRLGLNLGADDYLTKPVSRDGLMTAIRMRLKRHAVIRSSRVGKRDEKAGVDQHCAHSSLPRSSSTQAAAFSTSRQAFAPRSVIRVSSFSSTRLSCSTN